MHNRNNIPDLVISKAIVNKCICDVLPGPYISDLCCAISIQMIREKPRSEIMICHDMRVKGAHNVFQQVNFRVKDFTHIDDIVEHLDSQIDKALNEVALKCKKIVHKRNNNHGTIQLLKGRRW